MENTMVSGVGLPFSTNPMIGGFVCSQLRHFDLPWGITRTHTRKKRWTHGIHSLIQMRTSHTPNDKWFETRNYYPGSFCLNHDGEHDMFLANYEAIWSHCFRHCFRMLGLLGWLGLRKTTETAGFSGFYWMLIHWFAGCLFVTGTPHFF